MIGKMIGLTFLAMLYYMFLHEDEEEELEIELAEIKP